MPEKPAEEMVRGVRLMACLHYSVHPPIGDNAVGEAVMVFQIEDSSKFALTLPVTGIHQLCDLVEQVRRRALAMKLTGGVVPMTRPQEVNVGHSSALRGCVILQIDAGRESELNIALPDHVGLGVAEGIEKDVFGRMTHQERRKYAASKSKLMVPERKLILS